MLKFLKGVVGGSGTGPKDLPYNIGDPYASAWGSWTHFRGTSKDDGSSVSIFSLTGSNAQDGHLAAGRNGVKRLRTVRHPNILSFLHSTEAEVFDGTSMKHTIYIVTEPVMPLSEKLKELGLEGSQRDEYYAWGLRQIAKAVSFLNNDCKLVHGNVCMASVVVTQTLDWKLHAFDVLSEFDGNSQASGPMLGIDAILILTFAKTTIALMDSAIAHSLSCYISSTTRSLLFSPYSKGGGSGIGDGVDDKESLLRVTICACSGRCSKVVLGGKDVERFSACFAYCLFKQTFGCFIYEIFSGLRLVKTEELRNTASIPKSLIPDYQRLLSSVPSRRLNSSKLIDNSEYFQNKLVETIQFMEILSLKDSVEKDTFFRKLPSFAEQLPRQIVLKKLLPLLASALEFGSAAAPALTSLLKMGSWFAAEEFNAKVLPTIVKLFASNDRAIRVGLLQHIDQYGESLSAQVVDEQVYTHIATGFSDTSAFLRELTLKSILVLAPKLSQRTISGSLLKYLSKLQVDEEPAIRTNTTILLGNIAGYLNEGMRKRVLINAFTVRALRDTFSPARGAGVMALCATSSYYDAIEIATRILPNVIVLAIDPDGDVRSKAFQAVDQFLQILKQHNEKVNSGDPDETSSIMSSIPGNASLLGWAMSSLTSKSKTSEQAPVAASTVDTTIASSTSNAHPGFAFTVLVNKTTWSDRLASSSFGIEMPSFVIIWRGIKFQFLPNEANNMYIYASSTMAIHSSSTTYMDDQPTPSSPTSTDGWGELENGIHEEDDSDKDGWDDVEPLEEQKPTPSLANIQAAQKRPVSQPKPQAMNARPKNTLRASKDEDDDTWGSIAAPAPKTTSRPLKTTNDDEDDPWASIAAPVPTSTSKPLKPKPSVAQDDDDPWAAIAAPPPTTKAKPLSMGRGRGTKPAAQKLGAQRINRTSSTGGL
ncbi:hypothetical protein Sjap_014358 [Stephania japonica]|uniref:Protein kinase domain-containing protein n=1 Tax=Stephania japonica TaxID=461633 RepID=A0AAP0J293_9MAGN